MYGIGTKGQPSMSHAHRGQHEDEDIAADRAGMGINEWAWGELGPSACMAYVVLAQSLHALVRRLVACAG